MSTEASTAAHVAIAGTRKRKASTSTAARKPAVEDHAIDHGADGPAALARPRKMERVATGNARQGREGADAVRYQDGSPWHHYAQAGFLTERQLDAGRRLTQLYQAGFSPMVALPSYGSRSGASLSDEEDAARSQARREYCRLADLIPHSARHAMACMVRDEFPTMTNRLAYVREGCDVIADFLKLPRN